MYPISDFAYGMLSIVILYVTVGLIFQAIKKPLLALKMVLMIVIPLITTWSTIIFVDRRFSSIDGDRTAQTLVSIIVGILVSFSAATSLASYQDLKRIEAAIGLYMSMGCKGHS